MKIVSINVGRPREIAWKDRIVTTAIFKSPVAGPVAVRRTNLAGDGQADLTVHGGEDKAVYVYAAGHYPYWRERLPGLDLAWGAFGENLTLDDFTEDSIRIGDEFVAADARFIVTQPRMPCYKLGLRLGRDDMIDRFLESGRSGFYLRVAAEGTIAAGQSLERVATHSGSITVAEAAGLYTGRIADTAILQRAIETPALPVRWRERFRRLLVDGSTGPGDAPRSRVAGGGAAAAPSAESA